MPSAIVLAITADNAEALLSGERVRDHRHFPPRKRPAGAYLAVVGTGSIVGECGLGAAERRTAKGWALPVSQPPSGKCEGAIRSRSCKSLWRMCHRDSAVSVAHASARTRLVRAVTGQDRPE
jgi:hypothetical protein